MMQDDEGGKLVEALAIALYGDIGPDEWDEVPDASKDMCRFNVRRILTAIEREGFKVMSKAEIEEVREAGWQRGFEVGGSCDNY